jgi:hypothetical protein
MTENIFQIGQKVQINICEGLTHVGTIESTCSGYPLYLKGMVKVSDIGDPVNIDQVKPLENWVAIPGLYRAAENAYRGISFSPEVRAKSIISSYEEQLNDDLKNIPEDEKQRYIDGYKKYLFAWIGAMSRCLSSMITGPARFPVERNRKANESEHKRSEEFTEWREKALKYIAKKKEDSKPQEIKDSEQFMQLKKQVDRLFEGWGVVNFKGRLETVAKSGNYELVTRVLEYLKFMQVEKNRVLVTSRNSIWTLANVAEVAKELAVDKETAESKEYQINGVKVLENIQADRIQLFFNGKPKPEIINELKHNAFKWSPFNGCWQRQLTRNAIWATESLLKKIA